MGVFLSERRTSQVEKGIKESHLEVVRDGTLIRMDDKDEIVNG